MTGHTDQTSADRSFGDYLALLAVISQDFATSLDVEATLRRALQHIMTYMDAEAASVFLLENDDRDLICRVSIGQSDITGVRLAADEGIVGQSVTTKRSLIIRDAREDPNFYSGVDDETGFETRSILCAPLAVSDRVLGALELINKRTGDGLFEARDVQMLQALASSAAMALTNARMTKVLVEQERLRREIELAAELQRSLLPRPRPASSPIHGLNLPARTVSGDFFDYFDLPDGRICFNVGDVSGKGINASLLMAKTASLFRCLGKAVHEPGRLLGLINQEICETASRGMFVTMIGGIYDPASGNVRLANAGHEPALCQHREGGFVDLAAEAPPLGIATALFENDRVPEIELNIGDGSLYLFTDGVTEGRLAGGEMLGADGLKTLLEGLVDQPAAQRLAAVAACLRESNRPLHDDVTMVVIDGRNGTTAP